jgi:hypothetical protein
MRSLILFSLVTMTALGLPRSMAVSPNDGNIRINSYSSWTLEIYSDGSGVLIHGSMIGSAAKVPKGTYNFEALRKALPSQFSAGPANREKYCFQITVFPPDRKNGVDDDQPEGDGPVLNQVSARSMIVGHSYNRKLLDPLFETALKVGDPVAPDYFREFLSHNPVLDE